MLVKQDLLQALSCSKGLEVRKKDSKRWLLVMNGILT